MRIARSSFVRNVVLLMSGTAAAQAISLAAAPLLTRLYAPGVFGEFSIFLALAAIVGSVGTLRYDQAVMLPESGRAAAGLFGLSLIAVAGMTTAAAVICIALAVWRSGFPELSLTQATLALVPVVVLITGLSQTFNCWLTRQKRFHQVSIAQVLAGLTTNGIQLAAGVGACGIVGLLSGALLGSLSGALVMGAQSAAAAWPTIREAVRWTRLRALARQYSDFPAYSAPQVGLNTVSQNVPVLLLGWYYGPIVAACYFLATRCLQFPMNLVLNAFRQAFFQKASEADRAGEDMERLLVQATGVLLGLAAIPALTLFVAAPALFAFVFGAEWQSAGEYARWLVCWLVLGFANSPAVVFGQVFRRQRWILTWDIGLLISRTLALVLGGTWLSALGTIVLYSFTGIVFNAWIIVWGWRLARRPDARAARASRHASWPTLHRDHRQALSAIGSET